MGSTSRKGFAMMQSTEIQRFALSPTVFEEARRLGDPRADRLRGVGIRVGFHYETGEPWFVARDVCEILDIQNPSDAVTRLDDDQYEQVAAALVSTEARPQDRMLILSESGLYQLILGSRKPVTRPFRRWVTDCVLPSIRKTGAYAVEPSGPPVPTTFAEALELAAKQARDLEETNARLEAAQPKVEAFEELMATDGTFSLAQAAQLVGIGRQTLIEKLAAWHVLMLRPGHSDHLRPYQAQLHLERFTCVAQTVDITHGDGTTEKLVKSTTRVTAKGVEWIRTMLRAGGPHAALGGNGTRKVSVVGVVGSPR